MQYGHLVTLSEDHKVTAAEAAYGVLICIFLPGRPRSWGELVPANFLEHREEEWLVESMNAIILDATRTQYEGRVIQLITGSGNIDSIDVLPGNQLLYLGNPAHLARPVMVKHGVAVQLSSPAYLENDNIVVNLAYRVVTHD